MANTINKMLPIAMPATGPGLISQQSSLDSAKQKSSHHWSVFFTTTLQLPEYILHSGAEKHALYAIEHV